MVSSEHILIGDELFVRFHHGDGQLEDIEFTPVTPGSLRDEFVDESLTMAGRAGASLDRIIRYLEDVEFDVAEIEPRIIDGRRQIGYEVAFDGAAISSFLRDEQLERVGPSSPDGSTVYEFWIDEAGHLARLKLEGVHFEDGEALHGFSGELLYTLKDATEIVRP
ncbi:MAG: hypothetical protein HKN94_06640 [Acidimicrobiales bacterium]|nr:hypothetical protein [Acidimicrobiales bacterium]